MFSPAHPVLFGGYSFQNQEAKAIVNAMAEKPPIARRRLIDQTVGRFKADGLWTKLDVLFMYGAHSQQAALLNWKTPTVQTAAIVGAVTFSGATSNTGGFASDGTTGYLNLGFAYNTYLAQNTNHIGGRISSLSTLSNTQNAVILGREDTNGRFNLSVDDATGTKRQFGRQATSVTSTVVSTSLAGNHCVTRRSSTEVECYRNGSSLQTLGSYNSEGVGTGNAMVLQTVALAVVSPSTLIIQANHIGGVLSDTEVLNLSTTLDFYFTGLL
jgi:hypothetical protein